MKWPWLRWVWVNGCAHTKTVDYALLLPRWKYVWPLKAALWHGQLSKHVVHVRLDL